MFVQMRMIAVEAGYADSVAERFSQRGLMDGMEGFIDRIVMVKTRARNADEVLVLVRWESEEAWKNWEKSDTHVQAHRQNAGKPKPPYILNQTFGLYEVRSMNGTNV
jgi:heme oxygenase (staphylobilin-producing)